MRFPDREINVFMVKIEIKNIYIIAIIREIFFKLDIHFETPSIVTIDGIFHLQLTLSPKLTVPSRPDSCA